MLMGIIYKYCEKELGLRENSERWTLQGILDKDKSSILSFLVEIAMYVILIILVCLSVLTNYLRILLLPLHVKSKSME
jgi:hypothetical protein